MKNCKIVLYLPLINGWHGEGRFICHTQESIACPVDANLTDCGFNSDKIQTIWRFELIKGITDHLWWPSSCYECSASSYDKHTKNLDNLIKYSSNGLEDIHSYLKEHFPHDYLGRVFA